MKTILKRLFDQFAKHAILRPSKVGKSSTRYVSLVRVGVCALLLSLSSVVTAKPDIILVLGDSLSAEYGLQRNTGWVEKMRQALHQSRPDTQIINASISGDTTSGGLARLPALLQQHQPSWVILELGANDGLRGFSVVNIEQNLDQLIQISLQNKAKVLVIGMRIPPNYGQTYSEQFFQLFKTAAQRHKAAYVSFLLEGVIDHPDWFQQDHIHPTEQAQETIMKNVYNVWLKQK